MTLKELFEKFPVERYGDLDITVAKYDKNQLTCNTTVRVEKAYRGFDWTNGQVVLEPVVRLNTHPEEVEVNLKRILEEKARMRTNNMSVWGKLSRYIEDELEFGPKKDRIKEIMNEIQ